MKLCPTCGVQLADPLVNAIIDPSRDESCPLDIKRRKAKRDFVSQVSGTELMISSMMEEMEPY